MSQDAYVPPTGAQLRHSLLLEAAKYIEEGNGLSPTWAESLVSRLREEAESDPCSLHISAFYDNPFGEAGRDIANIQLRFVQSGSAYENYLDIDQAELLIRLATNAVVEAKLARLGTEPDPELVALHDPGILQSARAITAFYGREVYVFFPEDGGDPALCPDAPDTDLFVRVDATGATHLTDERGVH